MNKEQLAKILGGLLALIIMIPIVSSVFNLQLGNSLFKGFRYVDDERCDYVDKVVYHGKLKKLATRDEDLLFNFLAFAEWEDDRSTGKYSTVCRIECKDYIITYCRKELNPHAHPNYLKIYRVKLPENIVYYGRAHEDNVDILVIDRKTKEVTGFVEYELEDWLRTNFQYER